MSPTGEPAATVHLPDCTTAFPGPYPTSPHAAHTEAHLRQWLDRFPLIPGDRARTLLAGITGQGMARALPDADPDSLALCAELLAWLTAFDDIHGETANPHQPDRLTGLIDLATALTAALNTDGPLPAGPFPAALDHVLTRLRARARPDHYQRLTSRIRGNLIGIVWEAHHRTRPQDVTLTLYRTVRPTTVFVHTLIACAQLLDDTEPLPDRHQTAVLRGAETAVADLAGWANDIASYPKEAAAQTPTPPLSLVTLLIARDSLTPHAALAEAERMCQERARTARTHLDALAADAREPVRRHARIIEHVAHAYLWHLGHERYTAHPARTGQHVSDGPPRRPASPADVSAGTVPRADRAGTRGLNPS
ncbi:hypothetical protein AB0D49_33110 [Streptomyces sp. NPDC048290]|uniref:terpene synthase family protein n=1 Tax=Streptomyces sp. NPDC048290 TaxID=3155811 RepID=UPI003420E79C